MSETHPHNPEGQDGKLAWEDRNLDSEAGKLNRGLEQEEIEGATGEEPTETQSSPESRNEVILERLGLNANESKKHPTDRDIERDANKFVQEHKGAPGDAIIWTLRTLADLFNSVAEGKKELTSEQSERYASWRKEDFLKLVDILVRKANHINPESPAPEKPKKVRRRL